MDVLENGQASRFASHFDIDWNPVNPDLQDKVLLPVLGEQYGQALEGGKLRVAYDRGGFTLSYYETTWPLAPRSYAMILASRLDYLCKRLGDDQDHVLEYRSILTALENLPPRQQLDPHRRMERYREMAIVRRRLATLVETSPDVRATIDSALEHFNGKVGNPTSFDPLDELIASQPYRPAYWRVAMDEINYRRFFDINDLAAIRTELPEVFEATHEIPLRLLVEGKIAGLRVDHPDGLYDPARYFQQLQEAFTLARIQPRVEKHLSAEQVHDQVVQALGELAANNQPWPVYIVAEKILGEGEPLPRTWAIDGTTGYDFLVAVSGLFVDGSHAEAMERVYGNFIGESVSFSPLVIAAKKMIMQASMASEINSLSHQLDRLAERNRRYRDFTLPTLTEALRDLIACLSVYRTYTTSRGEVSPRDREVIEAAAEEARRRNPRTAESVFTFLRETLLLKNLDQFRVADRQSLIEWVLRFQQVTGPIMAKGIEDTTFYVYNRLVSLNEVGGHPHHFGLPVEAFHALNRTRADDWPHTMLALSTHDTKRSEDVRARLNVLSEMPDEWERHLQMLRDRHAELVTQVDGQPAPSANDQYFFYQTLLGLWTGKPIDDTFRQRLLDYMTKATREAKQHTSWINANEPYDTAVRRFVTGILAESNEAFLQKQFGRFAQRVSWYGRFNSLVQVGFKLTSPGVPDTYQGCELWELTLVDPDNRRPVDYELRRKYLAEMRAGVDLDALCASIEDGRLKMWVTLRLLDHRRKEAQLYAEGSYMPIHPVGAWSQAVCAYLRVREPQQLLVAGCIRPVGVTGGHQGWPTGSHWGDTWLPWPTLPAGSRVRNLLSGEELELTEHQGQVGIAAARAFTRLPLAVLAAPGCESPQNR